MKQCQGRPTLAHCMVAHWCFICWANIGLLDGTGSFKIFKKHSIRNWGISSFQPLRCYETWFNTFQSKHLRSLLFICLNFPRNCQVFLPRQGQKATLQEAENYIKSRERSNTVWGILMSCEIAIFSTTRCYKLHSMDVRADFGAYIIHLTFR